MTQNKQVDKKDIALIRKEVQSSVSSELVAVRLQLDALQHGLDRITTYFLDGDEPAGVVPFAKQIEINRQHIAELQREMRENDIVERVSVMYESYRDLKGTVRVSSVGYGFVMAIVAALTAIISWVLAQK